MDKMNSLPWRRMRLLAMVFAAGLLVAPVYTRAQDDQAQQAQAERPRRGRGGAGAGGPGGGVLSPVQTVERLREQVNALKLKDDQKTRLDAIFKEAADQAKSLETEVQSLQGRDRAQKLQPFARDLREKVNGVLDEEQRQALRKNAAERQARQMTERWKQALGQLNLTSEQQTKADAVLADAQKKLEAQAAEPGSAGNGGAGRGPGGRGGALMQETRQKIQEILTADQQKKLGEIMPERGRGGAGAGRGRGAASGGAGSNNQQ